MKTLESICQELAGTEGVLGACVWAKETCLAFSLPKDFSEERVRKMGAALMRFSQLAAKAGCADPSCTFFYRKVSVWVWAIPDGVTFLLASNSAAPSIIELSASIALDEISRLVTSNSFEPPPAQTSESKIAAASSGSIAVAEPVRPVIAREEDSRPAFPSSGRMRAASPVAGPPARPSGEIPKVGTTAPPKPASSGKMQAAMPVRISEDKRLGQIEALLVSELGPSGASVFARVRRELVKPGVPDSEWLPQMRAAVLAEIRDRSARAVIGTSTLWLPP